MIPVPQRSTRTTVRISVQPKLPGTGTCVVKTVEALNAELANLELGQISPGMSKGEIANRKDIKQGVFEPMEDMESVIDDLFGDV